MRCDDVELSAYIDNEADDALAVRAHLVTCEECRAIEAELRSLRSQLRYEVDLEPPDFTDRILTAMAAPPSEPDDAPAGQPERRHRPRRRTALAAAGAFAVSFIVAAGFTTVRDGRREQAAAQTIDAELDRAQVAISPFRAELRLVQRDAEGAVTASGGELVHLGPERVMVNLSGSARSNTVVVDDTTAWLAVGDDVVQIDGLSPFGSLSATLGDLVVPVRGLDRWPDDEVIDAVLDGRDVIEVRGAASQFATLMDALELVGVRPVHPTDAVTVALDAETLVPARIVATVSSDELRAYDAERDVVSSEVAGTTIIDLVVGAPVAVPAASPLPPPPAAAERRNEGFIDGSVSAFATPPTLPNGLSLHRTGSQTVSGTDRTTMVASWGQGRAWVRVVGTIGSAAERPFGIGAARPVQLGDGIAYVDVAGSVAIHTPTMDVAVTGTVAPDELLAAAAALGLRGQALDSPAQLFAGSDAPGEASVLTVPSALPSATVVLDGGALLVTELDVAGEAKVTLTQRSVGRLSPPSEPGLVGVDVRGVPGRYSPSAGTLQWIEDEIEITLAAPGLAVGTLVELAASLEPEV
jgi:hypothetical protein